MHDYSPVTGPCQTAEEYWQNPPKLIKEHLVEHKTGHADYMDFAESYADYVVDYEKRSDYQRGGA